MAQCVAPIPLKIETIKWSAHKLRRNLKSDIFNVPCGKCINCRKGYINDWVLRLTNEYKASTTTKAYFVTLTYEDKYLNDPEIGNITEDGEITLNYKHHQDYMKRLRKSYKRKNNIKYFTVGEYGEQTGRPHFHSIIFNASQQKILDAWHYGNVHFGEFNEATIRYTLKYALKRIGRVHDKNYTESKNTRQPERTLISRGIGLEWCTKRQTKNYYQDEITRPVQGESGRIQRLPRYYKNKLFSESQIEARSTLAINKMQEKSPTLEQVANAQQKTHHEYIKEKARKKARQD